MIDKSGIKHFLFYMGLSIPMEGRLLRIQNHRRFMYIETIHLDELTFLLKIMFEIDGIEIVRKMHSFCLNQNFHRMESIHLI